MAEKRELKREEGTEEVKVTRQHEVIISKDKEIKFKKLEDFDFPTKVKEEGESVLLKYRKKMEQDESFDITFSRIDKRGSLVKESGDYRLVMSNKEISGMPIKLTEETKNEYLKKTYTVKVKSIDEDKKTVLLSARMANEKQRAELDKLLREGIAQKEYLRVPARIVRFAGYDKKLNVNTVVIVEVGGLGLTGMISLKDWSTCYTSNMRHVTKVGDVIEVVVTGIRDGKGTDDIFICNRRLTIDKDPWQGIEKRLPVNTRVRLTCLKMEDTKFFGHIEGLDEINVYCEYPDAANIFIAEGYEYIGVVAKVSEEKKLLKVRILDYISCE